MSGFPYAALVLLLASMPGAATEVSAQQAYSPTPTSGSRSIVRPEVILQSGHAGRINCIACTPDGRYVVTGSDDGTVAIWDADKCRKLRVHVHPGRLESLAVSTDSRLLATAGYQSSVVIRRLETGEVIRQFTTGSYEGCVVEQVAFSLDGNALLTGSSHDGLQLWNTENGELLRQIDEKQSCRAIFGPQGRTIVSSDYGGAVTIWDTASGAKLFALDVIKGDGSLFDLALSDDGKRLATVSVSGDDFELSLWDIAAGRKLRSTSDSRHKYSSVRFSSDGKWLLSAGENLESDRQEVRRWDSNLEHPETLAFPDVYGFMPCIERHPDGRRFFIEGKNGLTTCDIDSLKSIRAPGITPDPPQQVVLHPTRLQILCQFPNAILSWDPAEGRPRVLAGPAAEHTFEWLAAVPDGTAVLSWQRTKSDQRQASTRQRRLVSVDLANGAVEPKEPVADPEGARLYRSTLSRNGRIVATVNWGIGSWDNPGSVQLFDALSGQLRRELHGHSAHAVNAVAISADGSRILSAGAPPAGDAILWDADTGRELRRLGGEKFVSAVGLHPNGRSAVIGFNREAVLWNLETGETSAPRAGHSSDVEMVLYSRDAQHAATFGDRLDRRILLWDTVAWQRISIGEGHAGGFYSASFSHDDRFLATSSADGTIRIWDAANGGELACLVVWNQGKDWLVAAPDGRFDCSPGARDKFLFRVGEGLEVHTADDFASTLYAPRLLAQALEEHAALADTLEFPAKLPNVFPLTASGTRPWTNEEQEFVRRVCARALRVAPGVWQRATACRPVRFYRAPSDALSDPPPQALVAANGVYLGDRFFSGDDPAMLADRTRTLLRLLVELVDGDLRLAASSEWSDLIGPRIIRARRDVTAAGGQGFIRLLSEAEAAADEKQFQPLAQAQGLPSLSACRDLEQALAECVARRGPDYQPPQDIAAFLNKHLLQLPYVPEPRLKSFHEVLELYADDDSRGPSAWDELANDPTLGTRLRLWRGYWSHFKSKYAEAAEDYAAAAASLPSECSQAATAQALLGEVLAKLNRKPEALAAFDQAVAGSVETTIPSLLRRGFAWESWGELSRAADDYSSVIKIAPLQLPAWEYRAAVRTKLYHYEEAAADYSRLLELRPAQESYLRSRADSWAAAGRYADALKDYDGLLQAHPQRPDLLVARGRCRLNSGDFTGAADDAAVVRSLLPLPVLEAVRLRASSLIRSGKSDLAVAEMDDLVARMQQAPFWRRQRAEVLAESGNYVGAISEFDALLAADPRGIDVLLQRGAAKQATGDFVQALADYDAAIQLDKRRAEGYLARSWLLATCPDAARRNGRQAVDDALTARSLLPTADWKISATLAAAFAELGDFETAVQHQESAMASGAPPTEVSELRDRLALYRAHKPYHEPPATAADHKPAESSVEPPPAADVFELRLDIPEDAKVEIEGTDYGNRKLFSWKNLTARDSYVARARVILADGGIARRVFRIQGGRRLWLSAQAAERIIYSFADSDAARTDLYSMDPVTFQSSMVADNLADDEIPKLAPNGATIAYPRGEANGRPIYLIGVDGRNNRRLVSSAPAPIQGNAAWSPDGRRIAFSASSPGGSAELFVADVHTGLLKNLAAAAGYTPAWSPDGRQLVYGQLLKTQNELHVAIVSVSGGAPRTLVVGMDPTWSPDGTQIAFLQWQKAARRGTSPVVSHSYLCLMRDDGKELQTLVQANTYAWSPDGTALAFTTDDGLHVIQSDGTGRRTLVRGAPAARRAEILSGPCWSPDGLRIAYIREFRLPVDSSTTGVLDSEFEAGQMEVVDAAGGTPLIIGPRRTGWYSPPDWR